MSEEPLTAILVDEKHPELGLMRWWEGLAWETLDPSATFEAIIADSDSRQYDMELPKDWECGYLRAVEGKVEFVRGRPPKRQRSAPRRLFPRRRSE
jgi:hypothetical protein